MKKTARDVEDEAAKWLVLNDKSILRPEEIAAFEAWLAADARHRAAYLRLKAAWRRTDQLRRLRPYDDAVDEDLLAPEEPQHASRGPLAFGVAAFAVVALIALGTLSSLMIVRAGWETAATTFGGHEQLALADGSTVHLNTDSEVKVRLTRERRAIVVVRGEAHFTVAHDPRRPFEVEANGAVVRAVGTAFTVRLHNRHRLDVLVDEGRVSIALAGKSGSVLHTLSAGHTAAIERERIEIRRLAAADVRRKLAWTEGRIWFNGETLAEAAAEFNRYNHRRLTIADPAIAERTVGGSFENRALDEFVSAIELSHPGVRAVRLRASDGSPGEIRLLQK